MSNLSELLPSGGGQNAVDFVASGTLSSGQTVALKTDGTVEAVSATGLPQLFGTINPFGSSFSQNIDTAYVGNGKIIVAASFSSSVMYAYIGTVSGTTISFGGGVQFGAGNGDFISCAYDSVNDKVLICYRDSTNSLYGTAIIGDVSGTSITFGSSVVFSSTRTEHISASFNTASGKFVVAYLPADATNSYLGYAIVGTYNAVNSITFGTRVNFRNAVAPFIKSVYDPVNAKTILAYRDETLSQYGYAIVGTVSGTSISFGTQINFSNNTSVVNYISIAYSSLDEKIVIVWQGTSNYGYGVVGTVSGTSISFGSPTAFTSTSSQYNSVSYDVSANVVSVFYSDAGDSNYGKGVTGTISGTSISFSSPTTFESDGTLYISSAYDPVSSRVVIAYEDDGNSDQATAVVLRNAGTNSADFIGITAEAIADTATGSVNTFGGINEAQSGLTIAADYYVQDDGTLSTTASSVKVGQAISATTINMKDLT